MFARLTLRRAAPRLALAAPSRALHASRSALADASVGGRVSESPAFKKISRSNVHVLDSATLNTWVEIPKGGIHGSDRKAAIWSIWYNHAIIPLYAVSIIAGGLSCFFMWKYFTRHTEIAWSKSVRASFDHTGEDERKANAHDSRLLYSGIRERNKKPVTMFPFNFMPMQDIATKHHVPYPNDA